MKITNDLIYKLTSSISRTHNARSTKQSPCFITFRPNTTRKPSALTLTYTSFITFTTSSPISNFSYLPCIFSSCLRIFTSTSTYSFFARTTFASIPPFNPTWFFTTTYFTLLPCFAIFLTYIFIFCLRILASIFHHRPFIWINRNVTFASIILSSLPSIFTTTYFTLLPCFIVFVTHIFLSYFRVLTRTKQIVPSIAGIFLRSIKRTINIIFHFSKRICTSIRRLFDRTNRNTFARITFDL